MEYVDKQIKVAKEAYEVMQVLNKIVVETKLAMVDGFQITDVVTVLTKVMPELVVAMQGMDKILPDAKEDLGSTIAAGAVGGMEIAKSLMK